MKRSLIFCAIALVAVTAHTAVADLNVQLNLQYTDPANEAEGGTWELLAGSTGGGIAGISALVDNINNDAVADAGNPFGVFQSQQVGSVVEIVTGHDDTGLATGATDVGLGDSTTANVVDDLFGAGSSPAIWENNALLASGTFGATRPAFLVTSGTLAAGANEFSGSDAVSATVANWTVRGDGATSDTLQLGDHTRDGQVNGSDLDLVLFSFNQAVAPADAWDLGDSTNDDLVNGSDLDNVLFAFNTSTSAPAISAVPEPTSVMLAGLSALVALGVRRR